MRVRQIPWKDEYAIGVEILDEAHKSLFEILHHILETYSEKNEANYQHVSRETIKYMKNYTKEHFAQEEAYMRSIRYPDLPMHQKLHRSIESVTIPQLEKDLEENNYSKESVLRMVGVVSGWLTGHILIEDMAITGKIKSRFEGKSHVDKLAFLDSLFGKMIKKTFDLDVKLLYENYNGEIINDPYLVEIMYESQESKRYRVVIVAEKSVVFFMTSSMLGCELETIGREAINAYIEYIGLLARRALEIIYPGNQFVAGKKKKLYPEDFSASFNTKTAEYSPVWRSKEGLFGFCLFEEE